MTWNREQWKRLLRGCAVVGVSCAPVSWLGDGFTPSWVVYPVLLLAGLWRLRGNDRRGVVFVGVSAAAFLLVHLPFSLSPLLSAENPVDPGGPYLPVQWLLTLLVVPAVTVAVAVLTWRAGRTAAIASPVRPS